MQQEIEKITHFLKHVFHKTKISKAVIAVSGGIDSAMSLTLLCKSLPMENIIPVLLPYKNQSTKDSYRICEFNKIPKFQIVEVNIQALAEPFIKHLHVTNELNKGNIIARTRMIVIYNLAKQHQALVCGTENKSEKYLGYFTRFGDEASDIEPLQHLYKTQIRQLAVLLKLPSKIIKKDPSAELWDQQTDENELGFSYEVADKVMEQYIDLQKKIEEIEIDGISEEEVKQVVDRMKSQEFKREVPYRLVE